MEMRNLDRLFKPRGIALFGGMNTPGSFGHMIATSQVKYGYQGGLYPISEKGGEILGKTVYTSLGDVPGPVDLASISVPAFAVPDVLRQCLKHGVAGAQVHSSGFAELGTEEGRRLQDELIDISRQGLRIIGPNCFGIHCPAGGVTLLPGYEFSREPGSVALISQSGGVATDFGFEALHAGLRISKVISFGNGCDLDALSLMEYLADDPETEYIAAYIEGVKDARRFLNAVRRVSKIKPVVIWKAGLTPLGGRAAQSHTGSMAGEAKIWDGALAQAGAVMVQGIDELMDALTALVYLKKPGKKIALVGGGGAIGVFSSDAAHRNGLDIPAFSPETQKILGGFFKAPGNSMVNPLDTGTPMMPIDVIRNCVKTILEREPVDVLVMVLLVRALEVELRGFMEFLSVEPPPRGKYLEDVKNLLAELKRETGKDIAVVLENRAYMPDNTEVEMVARRTRILFQEAGIPVFSKPARALNGIKNSILNGC